MYTDNYITVCTFTQGYKEKRELVATQLPLTHTIADFWQLILEKDIQIIVQLEGSQVGACFLFLS